ncbi:hypothetical protein EJ04DRAFT_562924 [Polyplosphaeria fusca]|uniref:Peptidase M43 pregnancy-associated plasma-A domain-containing protein n=1 Tax=Polyplosphaeria fusca TaxID=682080 RepID=A0A9P4V2V2_9PLEO|nr:hypothetical protein EJ04DRAFT_562924 [Polyplosphaeria fusca]
MKFSTALFGLLAPVALATECLNEDFDHDPLKISPRDARRALNGLRTRDTVNIETYLHILLANETGEEYSPRIDSQFEYLNTQYNKWGYNFNLKRVTFVYNEEWAKDIDVDKENKMHQLHRGNYNELNIYWVQGAGGGVCSLPAGADEKVDQDKLDFDGCFVGIPDSADNVSGTLTHEVGHWFGLFHVFQGGCDGDGDYCDDTSPQLEPSRGKLATPGDLNSCPAKESCTAGVFDNVKNYMDYTDCSSEFTPCQGGRMSYSWTELRNGRKLEDGVQVHE